MARQDQSEMQESVRKGVIKQAKARNKRAKKRLKVAASMNSPFGKALQTTKTGKAAAKAANKRAKQSRGAIAANNYTISRAKAKKK